MKLVGKTLKGKNRIKENGTSWQVFMTRDKVLFTDQPGPWLYLVSITTGHSRWVHATDDKDFQVIA